MIQESNPKYFIACRGDIYLSMYKFWRNSSLYKKIFYLDLEIKYSVININMSGRLSKTGRNQKAGGFSGLWGTNEPTFNQLGEPNFNTHYGDLVSGGGKKSRRRRQAGGALPSQWGTNEPTFNQLGEPNFYTHYGGGVLLSDSPDDVNQRMLNNLIETRDSLKKYIEEGYASANQNLRDVYSIIEKTLTEQAEVLERRAQKIRAGIAGDSGQYGGNGEHAKILRSLDILHHKLDTFSGVLTDHDQSVILLLKEIISNQRAIARY